MINGRKSSLPSQKYHHLFTLVEGLSPVMYAILNGKATHLHLKHDTSFPLTAEPLLHRLLTLPSNPLVALMAFIVSLDRFHS